MPPLSYAALNCDPPRCMGGSGERHQSSCADLSFVRREFPLKRLIARRSARAADGSHATSPEGRSLLSAKGTADRLEAIGSGIFRPAPVERGFAGNRANEPDRPG